jgi:hypothetical protein
MALPWLFFIAGILFSFHYSNAMNGAPGETGKAAMALLKFGYIGNPYVIPTGPTAHVSPVLVGLIALVYQLFGPNSAASDVVLGCVASALYALSVGETLKIVALCRLSKAAGWITLGLLIAVPFFLFQSTIYYRQWDQPFAAYILVMGWRIFEQSQRSATPYRYEAEMGVLTGLAVLISPTTVPAAAITLAGVIWTRRRVANVKISILICAAIIIACVAPWVVRNEIQFRQLIVMRSNFGLEMAVGNAPGALGYSGSGTGGDLHPHDSVAAAKEVARIGEAAYMREMSRRAAGWIAADPARFLTLTLQRMRLTFFPDRQLVGWQPLFGAEIPWLLIMMFGALRIAAIAAALLCRVKPGMALLYTITPLAPYFITHVNMRYIFPTYFVSIVLIAFVADRLFASRLNFSPSDHLQTV